VLTYNRNKEIRDIWHVQERKYELCMGRMTEASLEHIEGMHYQINFRVETAAPGKPMEES
jgi:hypothetical protein